jgi:hypothetical protein
MHPVDEWLWRLGQALKGQFIQLVLDAQHHFEGTTNTDGVVFDGGWVSHSNIFRVSTTASEHLCCTA